MDVSDTSQPGDLYVAPAGSDDANGEHPEPGNGSDGPFRTIERAQREIRRRRVAGTHGDDLTVWLRGGRYSIVEPLRFEAPTSSGVTYAAYEDEEPVVTGAVHLEEWSRTTVDGVEAWQTTVPQRAVSERPIRQLFVGGERRPRPRLPKSATAALGGEGPIDHEDFGSFAEAEGGPEGRRFVPETDRLPATPYDPGAIDVVAIDNWYAERAPIDDHEPDTGAITVAHRPYWGKEWADRSYYLENVREALSDPGEWYYDREDRTVTYLPRAGEAIEDVTVEVPVASQLVEIRGEPEADRYVTDLAFRGIAFRNTTWDYYSRPERLTGQSEAPTSGAIELTGAENCAFEDCRIASVGEYGIDVRSGCSGIDVSDCTIEDTGAGGIKIGSYARRVIVGGSGEMPTLSEADLNPTGEVSVEGSTIRKYGRVFHGGAGVLSMDAFDVTVANNHIHDGYYTGASVGWKWSYDQQIARDNTIEGNHIHDIGHGLLSDMGGVYTLGVQPGTVVRSNRIHDVRVADYGGWGIYPDQGSSHIVIADNVVYDTDNEPFGQNHGRENVLRNNVFAFGDSGGVRLNQSGDHVSFVLDRNVIVTAGAPLARGGHGYDFEAGAIRSDGNLFWDTERERPVFGEDGEYDLADWRERTRDRHSIVADPEFDAPDDRRFGFDPDSPAGTLGIVSPSVE